MQEGKTCTVNQVAIGENGVQFTVVEESGYR